MFVLRRFLTAVLVVVCLAWPCLAGFQSTETYLVAVGRSPGAFGAQIYSTVWATNLSGAPNSFTVYFLKQGQANTSPASFSDILAPGETKIYENIVESKFHLTGVIGAARIVSSGEILVSERIYNQASGADLGNTEGFFFAGVPKSFSISSGQSASIQGINQGGPENFRSNFILVEAAGASTTVNVQVFDANGHQLGQKSYPLQAYEQLQGNVGDIVPSIATTNGRITATVTGGAGSVLLAGAQVANESQDASGFEMSFRDSLLGTSGGTAGVTSLNGLTGALTLTPGSGISVTPSGSSIAIAFTGGGGSGLTSVTHDASLTGAGTGTSPLAIANGQVVRSLTVGSTTLHDNVTLAAGSNVTITPSGSTLTIASAGGGGGGLTLPFSASGSTTGNQPLFLITNTGDGPGINGASNNPTGFALGGFGQGSGTKGIAGYAQGGSGVFGTTNGTSGLNGVAGVWGDSYVSAGIYGTSVTNDGVYGTSTSFNGVEGNVSNSHSGVAGLNSGSGYGVYASGSGGDGLYATSTSGNGVQGNVSNNSAGVAGVNHSTGPGIYGENQSGGYAGDFVGDGVYTGSWTGVSDARFKKDVAPLEDALEGTLMLRGVTFDWRRDEFPERGFRARRDIGFIAQEVETIYPSLVVTGPDGYKSVDYAKVTPILVEAIRSQQRKIDELAERLERLEGGRR